MLARADETHSQERGFAPPSGTVTLGAPARQAQLCWPGMTSPHCVCENPPETALRADGQNLHHNQTSCRRVTGAMEPSEVCLPELNFPRS